MSGAAAAIAATIEERAGATFTPAQRAIVTELVAGELEHVRRPILPDRLTRPRVRAVLELAVNGAGELVKRYAGHGIDITAIADEELADTIDTVAELDPATVWADIERYRQYRAAAAILERRYLR